jgi:hypothetical protein
MTIWHALLLIYPGIDIELRSREGRETRFAWTVSDHEIQDALESLDAFPPLVESLTGGRAGIQYQIAVANSPLMHLATMGEDMYWPSPVCARTDLDRLTRSSQFDSIFVFWPQHNFETRTSIQSGGWGLAIPASASSYGATYASIANAERWQWRIPVVGEVWLHEWLHGVCGYFAHLGYTMPSGDADGGDRHGYVRSPTTGWTTYYRDLMNGSVMESGKRTGIPLEAWQFELESKHSSAR